MNAEQFQAYIAKAREHCRLKIEKTRDDYGLGTYQSYDTDLKRALLTFSDENGRERVRARIQVAGSWAPDSSTWLWSLDNQSIPDQSKNEVKKVRVFGQTENLPMIAESFEDCGEIEAWAMAAVAGEILNCEGFYRIPNKKNQAFLLLFEIKRNDENVG